MKTLNKKIFTAFLIVATITALSFSSFAQRRSSQNKTAKPRVERNENSRRKSIREKSTFKKQDTKRRTPKESTIRAKRSPRSENRGYLRSTNPPGKKAAKETTVSRSRSQNERKLSRAASAGTIHESRNERPNDRINPGDKSLINNNRNPKTISPKKRVNVNRSSDNRYANSTRNRTSRKTEKPAVRSDTKKYRETYRLDKNDKRYQTRKNYNGSKRYWNSKRAHNRRHYTKYNNNFYRKYDYKRDKHWDRKWERYRWNLNSWIDYYNDYHPYSYRFHRHYYHHPRFGHVIRNFSHRPLSFMYNHQRYYCHNGHFFRYFRGIGFVLTEMPFGILFEHLPSEYERVYINGFLYFRIRNLFFEMTPNGFLLVHYPERYFAYNTGF